jgi:hypothetical protein
MEVQVLSFTDESVEEIEDAINEFIPHYDVMDVEVVSREEGFLVMVFYEG